VVAAVGAGCACDAWSAAGRTIRPVTDPALSVIVGACRIGRRTTVDALVAGGCATVDARLRAGAARPRTAAHLGGVAAARDCRERGFFSANPAHGDLGGLERADPDHGRDQTS